jgi:GGDEF domain-containing protein
VQSLFDAFRDNRERSYLPVVDRGDRPVGLVYEANIKSYVYSAYGRELLANKAYQKTMQDFVSPCPVADVSSSVKQILEMYTNSENPAGVIITDDFVYAGFLTADSLLRVIEQKNLAVARDQNPLTRLPGNNAIVNVVADALEQTSAAWTLVYLDFDHFKPFNDTYGFRRGDRAILLFAELMQKTLVTDDSSLGHIGGDDFFAGFRGEAPEVIRERVTGLTERFERDVASLYEPSVRARGYLMARDRHDQLRRYPMLSCSAALVHLPKGPRHLTADELTGLIGELKHEAKVSADHICVHECGTGLSTARSGS